MAKQQSVTRHSPYIMATGSSETDRNLPLSYASLDHSEELKWPALFINDHKNTLFF